MPINLPDGSPKIERILKKENVFTLTNFLARKQDIRPLNLLVCNITPTEAVNTQLLRLVSNTPLQVDVTMLKLESPPFEFPTDISDPFPYSYFENVKDRQFDGLIIACDPVDDSLEKGSKSWNEIKKVIDWTDTHVRSTLYFCWGAQVGLHYKYGINKFPCKKVFGIFDHKVIFAEHELVRGFDERFKAPHFKHTEINKDEVCAIEDLEILTSSQEAGIHTVVSKDKKNVFVLGNSEYDYGSHKGKNVFNDESLSEFFGSMFEGAKTPSNTWRAHLHLLFSNWINYFVYQPLSLVEE